MMRKFLKIRGCFYIVSTTNENFKYREKTNKNRERYGIAQRAKILESQDTKKAKIKT